MGLSMFKRLIPLDLGGLKSIVISVGLALLSSVPSHADEHIIVTYTGTVTSLYDPDNFFGGSGNQYTDRFVFDVNKIYRTQLLPYLDELIGGPQFGTASPALQSQLTIGGSPVLDLPVNIIGQDFNEMGMEILSNAQGSTSNGLLGYNLESVLTNAPEFVTTPYSGGGKPYDLNMFGLCEGQGDTCGQYIVSGTLSPSAVTVTTVLPEPASWTLMILGFGGLGSALRGAKNAGCRGERPRRLAI
jgi:hypothetical protein